MCQERRQKPDAESRNVVLSGRDVDDARRLLSLLAPSVEGDMDPSVPSAANDQQDRDRLMARAREIYEERALRVRQFGPGMFGEPAWDMLLLLYLAESGARTNASRLASESGGSHSSVLRWLDYLEQRKLITREPHPTDRRTMFVRLSEEGRDALDLYLSRTIRPSSGY